MRDKEPWKRIAVLFFLVLCCLQVCVSEAWGEGQEAQPGAFGLEDLDLGQIEDFLRSQQSQEALSFQEVMKLLMEGNVTRLFERILESLKAALFSEISEGGKMMGQILALGILGAIFTNFSSVFDGSKIPETGFFVTYLLLFTLLTLGLGQSIQIAAETVDKICEFMKVLMPAYFLAVAFAGGSMSAAAMYEFTIMMLAAGQWLLKVVMTPAVRLYLLLSLASNMTKEQFFSKMTEMLEKVIGWGMKTLLGVVLGYHLIQGLLLPYVDSLKNGSLKKLVSLIPGVGQGAAAVTQMLLGSGVLIKNAIGMAAVVILMLLIAVPVIKLLLLMALYQCAAALMEPICDKRLVACIASAAKGHRMLLQIVMTAALLLVITVALVCAGTNVMYYV